MLNRKEVLYKLFPYHLFFSDGFLTNFQIEDERVYCAGDEHFWRGGRMRLALVTNALVLETNAIKTCVQA